jgi:hypothetical protein
LTEAVNRAPLCSERPWAPVRPATASSRRCSVALCASISSAVVCAEPRVLRRQVAYQPRETQQLLAEQK